MWVFKITTRKLPNIVVSIDLRAAPGASAGGALKAERDGPVLGSVRLAEARIG